MKNISGLVMTFCLVMPVASQAQKADGYDYQQNDNFPPGIYEASVDAKVYFDVNKNAIEKGVLVKKGTKISVYSAGYNGSQSPSIDWLNLSDGQECNGKILPWDKFGWVGVLRKDFVRIGDLPAPIYKNGLITNCSVMKSSSVEVATMKSPIVTIKAIPATEQEKGIKSRLPIEVIGKIEFGNDAAGGNFWINAGKKKQYTLVYVWDIDDATQAKLNELVDSGLNITVKGTLKVWKDGSAAFDNTVPINFYK